MLPSQAMRDPETPAPDPETPAPAPEALSEPPSEPVPEPVPEPAPEAALPEDPAVAAMAQCLAAGDHHAARIRAEALVKSDDPGQQEAGRAMLQRLRPDARVSAVFVVTGGLILALALHWLGHRA